MTWKALLATIPSTATTNEKKKKNCLRATFKHLQAWENKKRYSENYVSHKSPRWENEFAYVYWDRVFPSCVLPLFRDESCRDIRIYLKCFDLQENKFGRKLIFIWQVLHSEAKGARKWPIALIDISISKTLLSNGPARGAKLALSSKSIFDH